MDQLVYCSFLIISANKVGGDTVFIPLCLFVCLFVCVCVCVCPSYYSKSYLSIWTKLAIPSVYDMGKNKFHFGKNRTKIVVIATV